MKSILKHYLETTLALSVAILTLVGCERDISDEAQLATFSTSGDIFTDSPVGLGSDFYFPFGGSKLTAFSVDESEGFESNASMRIDVPNANDPDGNFAGAIFRIDGSGRDLTGFDALTFYARASQGVTINEIGFGQDFIQNRYQVTTSISLGTNWAKYVIPIPDPSKLVEERGMLWYSAGGIGPVGQETGYTFWLDEVRFEKLGTIGQLRPAIFDGQELEQEGFLQVPIVISGLSVTANTGTRDVTVAAKPSYFNFESSNDQVALVDDLGNTSIASTGEATITATLADAQAAGSLALEVNGPFDFAPTPTRTPENVISIFSDTYDNVPVDFFNGGFGGQTTEGGAIPVGSLGNVIQYTNINFVTTQFSNPTVDGSEMTHLHVDIKVREPLSPGDNLTVEVGDFGADGAFGGGNDTGGGSTPINDSVLIFDEWVGIDIPLTDFTNPTGGGFTGLASTSNLAQVNFVSSTIPSIFVDNIYFYKE